MGSAHLELASRARLTANATRPASVTAYFGPTYVLACFIVLGKAGHR